MRMLGGRLLRMLGGQLCETADSEVSGPDEGPSLATRPVLIKLSARSNRKGNVQSWHVDHTCPLCKRYKGTGPWKVYRHMTQKNSCREKLMVRLGLTELNDLKEHPDWEIFFAPGAERLCKWKCGNSYLLRNLTKHETKNCPRRPRKYR